MQKKITFVILAQCPQTTLHRKIIYNFVWIYLGQHCIWKLLAQCWPCSHRCTFAGKPVFEICLVVCFLTGYIITAQSWLILLSFNSGVHLHLAGQQWIGGDIDWSRDNFHTELNEQGFENLWVAIVPSLQKFRNFSQNENSKFVLLVIFNQY